MTKYYTNPPFLSSVGKPRKNPWLTALKVCAWVFGSLIVLAGIALWIISNYLTPERIAKLIEEKSSEYLLADVKIANLNYKLFSTYPWLDFEVDSLTVISKSLDGISPSLLDSLPQNSDFLAAVDKITGKINIHSLIIDKINLKDLKVVRPDINIVMVDDTLANFNILKKMPEMKKKPEFEISELNVVAPVNFDFFSLQKDMEGSLKVESFYLTRNGDDIYDIVFKGAASGRYHDYQLPGNIPIKFSTGIRPSLFDLSIYLNRLSVSLAGLTFSTDGMVKINQKGVDIQDAAFNVKIDDIFTLLRYLPSQLLEKVNLPEGVSGILPLNVSAALLSPYHLEFKTKEAFSINSLPAIATLVNITDANLTIEPPGGKSIRANDIFLGARCDFDPQKPDSTYLIIQNLRLNGEGIAMDASARIENILGEAQYFTADLNFSSPLMETLAYVLPDFPIKVAGFLKGKINVDGEAFNFGKEGIKNIAMTGDLQSHSLRIKNGSKTTAQFTNLKTDFDAFLPDYPLKDYTGTKIDFAFSSDKITADAPSMHIVLLGPEFKIDAIDSVPGAPDPYGSISLKLKNIEAKTASADFQAETIRLNASGTINSNPGGNYNAVPSTNGEEDALIAQRVKHTPLVVEYEGDGVLQTLMNMVVLEGDVSMQRGRFSSPVYLLPVEFSSINLSTNLNEFNLSAEKIDLGRSGMALNAKIGGLGTFMTSYSATPLKVTADINFSNVDINQLAWGYYGALIAQGQNPDSVFFAPPLLPYTAADSICVAIPRNIDATVHLHSKAAEYMQYQFAPLSTDILLKDGNATLKALTVGTPFCTAVVDWTYSTSMLNNIYMQLNAKVKNFSFSPFYSIFPSLVTKSPELKNFTGNLNADINCKFLMYPNMFMNSESLAANFNVKGTDLQFARTGKIERITHLMLIEGDTPIRINNIDIMGSFHDNLLEVNPFKIGFDDYLLEAGGINNIAGDMYYHLALEKSPFHLPFGVSLTGRLSHPEVRLGGTRINDFKAEEIPVDTSAKINANIMAYLRHGWLLFVQEAAKYQRSHINKNKNQ